jgi:AraC-like DNA-binding protein
MPTYRTTPSMPRDPSVLDVLEREEPPRPWRPDVIAPYDRNEWVMAGSNVYKSTRRRQEMIERYIALGLDDAKIASWVAVRECDVALARRRPDRQWQIPGKASKADKRKRQLFIAEGRRQAEWKAMVKATGRTDTNLDRAKRTIRERDAYKQWWKNGKADPAAAHSPHMPRMWTPGQLERADRLSRAIAEQRKRGAGEAVVRVLQLMLTNLTMVQIAAEVGVSATYVRRVARDVGGRTQWRLSQDAFEVAKENWKVFADPEFASRTRTKNTSKMSPNDEHTVSQQGSG